MIISRRINNIIFVLILVFLSSIIFSNSMTKGIGRDEHMYCTAGVLLSQGKMIYRDFSYVAQLPYHPLLCAILYKIFDTSYYLLTGRMVSVFCDILVLVCIVGTFRHVFRSFPITGTLLSLAGGVFYVFNPSVMYANGYAWNHDVVMACVVISYWLFLKTDFKKKGVHWRIAVIGCLLSFATWMRMTTSLVYLVFFAALFFSYRDTVKARIKDFLVFLSSTILISLWPLYLIFQSPRAFFLNVIRIPALNSQWLHEEGVAFNKILLTLISLSAPSYFVLILLVIYLYVTFFCVRRRIKISNSGKFLLGVLLAVVFFIIAYLPPTMWRQYLAMPVTFLIISLAEPLFYLRTLAANRHFKSACIGLIICTAFTINYYDFDLDNISRLFKPKTWTAVHIHKISEDISRQVKEPKLVLTLGPLYALEGGCDIYMGLSAGSFVYRVAKLLSDEERQITNTFCAGEVEELLKKQPASAAILGTEPEFIEEELQKNVGVEWRDQYYDVGLRAYFRP